MNKIKTLLLFFISAVLVFTLASCNKKQKIIGLYHQFGTYSERVQLNSGKEISLQGNDFRALAPLTENLPSLSVYRLLEDGSVQQLDRGNFKDGYRLTLGEKVDANGLIDVTLTDVQDKNIARTFKVVYDKALFKASKTSMYFQTYELNIGNTKNPVLTPFPFFRRIGERVNFSDLVKFSNIYRYNLDKAPEPEVIEKTLYAKNLLALEEGHDKKIQTQDLIAKKVIDSNFEHARYLVKNKDKEVITYSYQINFNSVLSENSEFTAKYPDFKLTTDVFVGGGQYPLHKQTFGWFDYLTTAWMGWLLGNTSIAGKFAIGIIFTTIIVRILAWPIYARTNVMSARMQKMTPDLNKLERKYQGRTDKASIQQKQMETMRIYRKHKVGFSSFLIPFLQMPIFIGVYNTINRVSVEGGYYAYQVWDKSFMGLNLGAGKDLTNYLLAFIVFCTMVLIQLISSYKTAKMREKDARTVVIDPKKDPKRNQRMMLIFGIIMAGVMTWWSINDRGLAFYWIVGNLFSIGQTAFYKIVSIKKENKPQTEELL